MDSNGVVPWLSAIRHIAKCDFQRSTKYEDDDVQYDEDNDKCKVGYVKGYIDALDMLINSFNDNL